MPGLKTNLFSKSAAPVASQTMAQRGESTNTKPIATQGEDAMRKELGDLLTYHLIAGVGTFTFLRLVDMPTYIALAMAMIAVVYTVKHSPQELMTDVHRFLGLFF